MNPAWSAPAENSQYHGASLAGEKSVSCGNVSSDSVGQEVLSEVCGGRNEPRKECRVCSAVQGTL